MVLDICQCTLRRCTHLMCSLAMHLQILLSGSQDEKNGAHKQKPRDEHRAQQSRSSSADRQSTRSTLSAPKKYNLEVQSRREQESPRKVSHHGRSRIQGIDPDRPAQKAQETARQSRRPQTNQVGYLMEELYIQSKPRNRQTSNKGSGKSDWKGSATTVQTSAGQNPLPLPVDLDLCVRHKLQNNSRIVQLHELQASLRSLPSGLRAASSFLAKPGHVNDTVQGG